ncbi:hypothetical protein [Herbiconiux ginsengi]|uniref:Uncharacterized protein n=1 Tax=Herbiconiux ginsengi TaxID=381665 RepID=A0A1H3MW68_9MICO|nr:hypothetical protein [Herbiconiux ginsengi]SDY80728.1 hypothetical protein SAMN05216554_1585 [Herbiconiux ginsengi]
MTTTEQTTTNRSSRSLDRRTLLRGAAWSVPVVALAVATPAAAASDIEVGAYQVVGTCGIQGVQGPGFLLTASSSAALPVGTTVMIVASGVANAGVFSVTGGTASQQILSGTARLFTLTAALPAGATMAFRTTLSTSVSFTLNASTQVPTGYTAQGAKTTGSVNSTLVLCSGS